MSKMQIPPPHEIEAEIEGLQKEIKELRSMLRVSQRRHGVTEPAVDQVAEIEASTAPETLPIPSEPDRAPEKSRRKTELPG